MGLVFLTKFFLGPKSESLGKIYSVVLVFQGLK